MSKKAEAGYNRTASPHSHGEILRLSPSTANEFSLVYRMHVDAIRAYLIQCGSATSNLDDLTQEVFSRAWQGRDSYDAQKGSVKGWLWGIATNLVRESWRESAVQSLDEEPSLKDLLATESGLGDAERSQALRNAIDRLRPAHREAIDLVYLQRAKVAEAAVRMNCSRRTLHRYLAEARAHLRLMLDE